MRFHLHFSTTSFQVLTDENVWLYQHSFIAMGLIGILSLMAYCLESLIKCWRRLFKIYDPRVDQLQHICESTGRVDQLIELIQDSYIDIDPIVFQTSPRKGFTPLTLVARVGHLDILRYFIETLHADFTKADEVWHASALHHACKNNHEAIVEFLLSNCPIDPNLVTCDGNLYTPLHWAAARNSVEAAIILLDHRADINCRDKARVLFYDLINKTFYS